MSKEKAPGSELRVKPKGSVNKPSCGGGGGRGDTKALLFFS